MEEDKITWYSNSKRPRLIGPTVWEAEEIAEFSNNRLNGTNLLQGLEGEEITGFSNHDVIIEKLHMGLGKSEITEFSNVTCYRIKSLVQVWRRIELQGSQTHFCPNRRFEKFRRRKKLQGFQTEYHNARQRRLEGGRNYMVLKLEKLFRMLHCGFGRREITWLKPDFLMCR